MAALSIRIDSLKICYINAAAPKIAPITTVTKIRYRQLIIRPAIARPLGFLHTPIIEKIRPKIHKIQSKTGTQQKIRPRSAKTKPAVPMPFF